MSIEGRKSPAIESALTPEALKDLEDAPPGWVLLGHLADHLGVTHKVVNSRIRPFFSSNPEWFGEYRAPSTGRKHMHIHPNLALILTQEIGNRCEPPPQGWMTAGQLASHLKIGHNLIGKLINPHRLNHPEWFRDYLGTNNRAAEHLSPDLISIITDNNKERGESAPDGWANIAELSIKLKVDREFIAPRAEKHRKDHPEWFHDYLTKKGNKLVEHFHPDLLSLLVLEVAGRGEPAPKGWITKSVLAKQLETHASYVEARAEKHRKDHPEWFHDYLVTGNNLYEHYHPELAAFLILESKRREKAPDGWIMHRRLAERLADLTSRPTLKACAEKYRKEHPEWFKYYLVDGDKKIMAEYYHPDLAEVLVRNFKERAKSAPPSWEVTSSLCKILKVTPSVILRTAEKYRKEHPEWFKYYLDPINNLREHFHPELVAILKKEISEYGEMPPAGWQSISKLVETLKVGIWIILRHAKKYRTDHPEWFHDYLTGRGVMMSEHFHPDLVKIISSSVEELTLTKSEAEQEERTKLELAKLADEVSKGNGEFGPKLRTLISIFGSSRCVDILFKFRPEFKGLPIEYVKKVIGEYLGDFLVQKGNFSLFGVTIEKEYFSDQTLREGLYENIKDNCLRYYYQEKRRNTGQDPLEIIYNYIEHVSDSLGENRTSEIDDVIQDVIQYYDEALRQFKKPDRFVDSLSQNREFPDINQKINMKELADKRRMLIADEMGLGKSASVIMAKENLGVKCAVVAAPANVIDTWATYLSDKKGGYFKAGEAPRVAIATAETLSTIEPGNCDYILISHESLKGKQVDELKRIGFDMLVVDEAHKVSNIKGARTEQLVKLSQEIEGDNKYLALLTGTPAQNKVKDLATAIRLLYPERFADVSDSALTGMIVGGDVIDLRSLLLPRMQMKELRDMLEMPKVVEEIEYIELSAEEKEISEIIVEEDEVTASEKMHALRQALLNPELVDMTPGIESSKAKALEKTIANSFQKRNRILVFVNDYVERLLRGDNPMIEKLNLPKDVLVRVVHGQTENRRTIQDEFNEPGDKKIVLFVGGQTGDVGVDYTGAEHVIFYNEPWTEFRKRQEISRADRPGQTHELLVTTLIAKGSIEEGIHEYKARKLKAIEKILKGVPLSELEEAILLQPETGEQNKEVNAELAEYFFSSWNKLMRMFGYIKEIGEEKFAKFLLDHASDYAHAYVELGNRSYQSNANRVTSTLIQRDTENSNLSPSDVRILDLDSGPEMLKRHMGEPYKKRVFSMDLNIHHFKGDGENRVVGSHLNIPMRDEAFNYVNFSLSWHYTKFAPSRDEYERVRVLSEINRVLKPGGKAFINIIYSLQLKDTEAFSRAVEKMGFKVVSESTGVVSSDQNYESTLITLEKVQSCEQDTKKLVDQFDAQEVKGFKFERNDRKLKNSRNIIQEFTLNGQDISVDLTHEDKAILVEERLTLEEGHSLKENHGSVAKIPAGEVTKHKFSRILVGQKHLLFRKLSNNNGAVIIK